MNLYKVTSPAHNFGTEAEPDLVPAITLWRGTSSDAREARITFEVPFKDIKPAKRPKVLVEEIDVPTNKGGLLDWLNANAV